MYVCDSHAVIQLLLLFPTIYLDFKISSSLAPSLLDIAFSRIYLTWVFKTTYNKIDKSSRLIQSY